MKKTLLFALVMVCMFVLTGCNILDYSAAQRLYSEGKYDEAIIAFQMLGDYKDSALMATSATYAKAENLYAAGNFEEAREVFESLSDYEDSADMVIQCIYSKGLADIEAKVYSGAVNAFREIPDYKDAKNKRKEAAYLLISEYVEKNGKSYGDLKDSIVLGTVADKAYAVEGDKDNFAYAGIKDGKLIIGAFYEKFMEGFYTNNGININTVSSNSILDFQVQDVITVAVGEEGSTVVSSGAGKLDLAAVTKQTSLKLDEVASTDEEILKLEQKDVNDYWKRFCTDFAIVLKDMGLTFEDIGFDKM